jgi:hypothetical protein
MEAISDDYYNEINLKFLIAEYERAKLDKQSCLQFLIETKTNPVFKDDRPVYSTFVKTMMIKERVLERNIRKLAKLVDIPQNQEMDPIILQLKLREAKLKETVQFRMKSKV